MAKHRTYSIDFKRQVAQEFLGLPEPPLETRPACRSPRKPPQKVDRPNCHVAIGFLVQDAPNINRYAVQFPQRALVQLACIHENGVIREHI